MSSTQVTIPGNHTDDGVRYALDPSNGHIYLRSSCSVPRAAESSHSPTEPPYAQGFAFSCQKTTPDIHITERGDTSATCAGLAPETTQSTMSSNPKGVIEAQPRPRKTTSDGSYALVKVRQAADSTVNAAQRSKLHSSPSGSPGLHSSYDLGLGAVLIFGVRPSTGPPESEYGPSGYTTVAAATTARHQNGEDTVILAASSGAEIAGQAGTTIQPAIIVIDPTCQTHVCNGLPPIWQASAMLSKRDSQLDFGLVLSPTFMIGLPCGGMIELASTY